MICVAGARRKISLYYCTDTVLTVRGCLESVAGMQGEVGPGDVSREAAAWNSWILIDVQILTQPKLMLQLLPVYNRQE